MSLMPGVIESIGEDPQTRRFGADSARDQAQLTEPPCRQQEELRRLRQHDVLRQGQKKLEKK